MTIHWKAVELYFTVVLFVMFFNINFGKFVYFGIGTLVSDRVKAVFDVSLLHTLLVFRILLFTSAES